MSANKTDKKRPWRENLEALTMAIVVALLFKIFVLEVSKIPSGSMQPTLLGDPASAVHDRVLVDKLSFSFRDPERFEIVVFRHPIERSRVMVKRLVGMPGEQLKIEAGDLWTRAGGDDEWQVLRRPDSVQREMWKRVDEPDPLRPEWKVVSGGGGWRIDGRDLAATGSGRIRFRPDDGPLKNDYFDGYPDAVSKVKRPLNRHWSSRTVGDLRLEADVEVLAGTLGVTFQFTEGLRSYIFMVPGPAADADAKPSLHVKDSELARQPDGGGLAESGSSVFLGHEPFRLEAGERFAVAVENLDDRLRLYVDEKVLIARFIDKSDDPRAFVDVALAGEGGTIEDLRLYRDVHYLPHRGPTWSVTIPDGHYVMLGDNTQDSADGRDWESIAFNWPADGDGEPRRIRGNFRKQGENPTPGTDRDGNDARRFKDEWGEIHWIGVGEAEMGLPWPSPLVPRELISGRALAVFWPLKPWAGLWRLGWLR